MRRADIQPRALRHRPRRDGIQPRCLLCPAASLRHWCLQRPVLLQRRPPASAGGTRRGGGVGGDRHGQEKVAGCGRAGAWKIGI